MLLWMDVVVCLTVIYVEIFWMTIAMTPLRWGICGAGKISNDFISALSTLPPENHKVTAIAARNLDHAKNYAEKFGIPKFYSDYGDLFLDKDIDVVYIGTIVSTHENLVIQALDAGKPVLCEKPMGVNSKQLVRMIQKAKEKNLFLMAGYWTRFFPAMLKMKEELNSGAIGEPILFTGNFGCPLEGQWYSVEHGGGTTATLGTYFPLLTHSVFFPNGEIEKPSKIVASAVLHESGVDESASVTLHYSKGRVATFLSSITTLLAQDACIGGTKGIMKITDHVYCPMTLITPNGTFHFPLPQSAYPFARPGPYGAGLRYEAEHVRECLINGYKESPIVSLKETLLIAEITEEIRKQIGVKFPQD